MRLPTKIFILFAVVFAAFLVKCDELTFLQDIHDISQSDNLAFVDAGVINDVKTPNLNDSELKADGAIPDYDMYVLSIQWGSKKTTFFNCDIKILFFNKILFQILF